MAMNKVKQLTTSIEKFESKRLNVTEFQDNTRAKGQKIAYIRYNHPSLGEDTTLMLQTPWITLSSGGIPRFNPDYHKNDRDRAFIRLPVEEGTEFFEKMTALDEQFTSETFKKEHFGKNYKKFSMYPIVKIPEHDEDDDREPLPPSMKLKFDLVWNEDDMDTCQIKSKVFISKTNESGKRTREDKFHGEPASLSDMESLIRLGSKMRLIIRPVKAWLNGKKEYGIIWKIMKMEVEPASNSNALMQAFYDADAFIDSDDDEESVELPKVAAKASNDDSDEDSEEESENEDSDEDSESDEDSPDIPVRRSKGKSKQL